MFGKNHCVSLGEKQQTVTVVDVSLLKGTSSTLSLLIQHWGPGELFEKCEFSGIVVRQTHAISTLHFALATNTQTHIHITYKVTVWGGLMGGVMCLHVCVCCIHVCGFVCMCVCSYSLSSPLHPVPACPAFRQHPDQPWGFQYNLLCIPTTFNGRAGISFRANCPNHSSADAAIQATRTVLDSECSSGVIFFSLFLDCWSVILIHLLFKIWLVFWPCCVCLWGWFRIGRGVLAG